MNPLPLPIRIVAGLVATAVEQARELPRLVIEFPVTAISHTLQASMRMQQKVTELAIKGDRVLGTLGAPDEAPAWATFDDEEPPRRNGASNTVTALRPPAGRAAARRATATPPPADPAPRDTGAVDTAPADTTPAETAATGTASRSTAREVAARTTAATEPPAEPAGSDGASGPNVLPGYRDLTIPQLRGRFRKLTEADLRALLAWETAHDNRPPFVTMLTNRITTVTEG